MSWHSAQSSVCARVRGCMQCAWVCARAIEICDTQCDVLRTFVTVLWLHSNGDNPEPELHSLYLSFLMVVTVFFWHKIDRKCVNSKQWKHTVVVANATWNVYTSRWSQRVCAYHCGAVCVRVSLASCIRQSWRIRFRRSELSFDITRLRVCVVFRCMNICCKMGK